MGTLAAFPYIFSLQGDIFKEIPLPIPAILFLSLIQTTALLSIAIFLGLFLGKKVGLGVPILSDWLAGLPIWNKLKSIAKLSVKLGILAGTLIIVIDYIFTLFIEPISFINPPIWQGFLASFYGGIVEEIFIRFFLITLIVWIFWKLSKSKKEGPSAISIWLAIIVASIIFGLGHLPATAALTDLTPIIIVRAIVLNGIGGIIFGWLYWKKGLESAIIAHFTADIILHVIYPLILV